MNKIYLLTAIVIFFNIAIAVDDEKSSFDRNRRLQDAEKNEILFQLNELNSDSLDSTLPLPSNNSNTDNSLNFDQGLVIEIDGTNQDLDDTIDTQTYPVDDIPNFFDTAEKPDSAEGPTLADLSESTSQDNLENPSIESKPPVSKNEAVIPAIPTESIDKKSQLEEKAVASPQLPKPAKPIQHNNKSIQSSSYPPLTQKQVERLQSAKKLYQEGSFLTLYRSKFTKNEFGALYYQALACYNLLRKSKKYQGRQGEIIRKERSAIAKRSKDNLFHVGRFTSNPELKERAIFWFAILSMNYPKKYRDEKEITDTFLYIEESMKDSHIYNDAIVYLAMIYKKLGKIKKAKEYYRKAIKTSPNDLVYNYKNDSLVPSKRILSLLKDLE